MSCIECGEHPKYKCPVCRQPYCSVPCFKKHKENPCSAPPDSPKEEINNSSVNYEYPSDDTVLPENMKLLENSTEVKQCLENPHVREILTILDKSPHPDQLMQEYMIEPIFTEFVDACLKVIQPQDSNDQ